MSERAGAGERTLDPADWEEFRRFAHRLLDETIDYVAGVRERPVWQPVPAGVRARLREPAPARGQGYQAAYADFVELVRPYPTGNLHPRFWGWVQGTGTPLGMLAELLAAAMNSNVADFEQSSAYVELQVIDWFKRLFGFPADASGLLVSGGSVANLVALAVARNTRAGFDVRAEGLAGASHRLLVYASSETHSSVRKAVELLGLGASGLRLVPVDPAGRIDLRRLRLTLAADIDRGHQPFCLVGNAGTVNTGAIDPLESLADICAEHGLWFHVDGAFGAFAMLSPRLAPRLAGMQRADSLIFDFHKWLYQPYEAAAVLVRSAEAQRSSFSVTPAYLQALPAGIAKAPVRFSELGLQLSRGFKALKVWLAIKAEGLATYARLIEQNVEQAEYLTARIEAAPDLELLAPTALNVVNFRYLPAEPGEHALDELNRRILVRLQEEGIAVPSGTDIGGNFSLRVANTNHRSRREDFDLLIEAVRRLGRELVGRAA